MRAVKQTLHIICIHDEWGLNHEQFSKLKGIIENNKPAYWEFSNPGTIIIYFKSSKKGISNSSTLIADLEDTKSNNPEFKNIDIGKYAGEVIFETNIWGKIISSPMGIAINKAMENARANNKK